MHSEEMKSELKILSNKHGMTVEQLKELIYLVFKYVRQVIKSAVKEELYFPSVRVMGIGIFHVTKAKQNKLKEKYDKDNSKEPES